ncbi:hypothetical protein DY000_02002633 [Brassica cretica]|uniref:Uncharacterized protein n=1 Tax=Brassica cretica TaxID=69181 RepID=A0ABQ7BSF0_BRACR|nr:hypothetical protein DY000_02002633 [Brassica cretica]
MKTDTPFPTFSLEVFNICSGVLCSGGRRCRAWSPEAVSSPSPILSLLRFVLLPSCRRDAWGCGRGSVTVTSWFCPEKPKSVIEHRLPGASARRCELEVDGVGFFITVAWGLVTVVGFALAQEWRRLFRRFVPMIPTVVWWLVPWGLASAILEWFEKLCHLWLGPLCHSRVLTFVGFRTCFGQVFDISRGMYPSVSLFQFLLRVSSGVKLRRAWMIALGTEAFVSGFTFTAARLVKALCRRVCLRSLAVLSFPSPGGFRGSDASL